MAQKGMTDAKTALDQWMLENAVRDRAMADKIGVSRPFISRIRAGTRRPSLKVALKLASETKLPVSAFMTAEAA